eukprot:1177889-Prorocentrum_minimum.AAC.8
MLRRLTRLVRGAGAEQAGPAEGAGGAAGEGEVPREPRELHRRAGHAQPGGGVVRLVSAGAHREGEVAAGAQRLGAGRSTPGEFNSPTKYLRTPKNTNAAYIPNAGGGGGAPHFGAGRGQHRGAAAGGTAPASQREPVPAGGESRQ